jgi:hypothetical protein
MESYTPGSAVAVTFTLLDDAGVTLEPTSLRWRVLDESDTAIIDWAPITLPVPSRPELLVGVVPELTTLPVGTTRGARSVELEIGTASGVRTLTREFLLQTLSVLVVGSNTFLNYMRALMVAEDFTEQSIAGWARETRREERERALMEAHTAILHLPLYSQRSGGVALCKAIEIGGMNLLDPALVKALGQAQVLEANELLNADPVALARRNGLLSMTVGESSQFFGNAKQLEMPVMSRQALKLLGPWINNTVRIGRVR